MVYLFESELPENKSVSFAITHVFGIGRSNSNLICKKLGFSKNLKIKDLTKEQISRLVQFLESSNIVVLGDLKKIKSLDKNRLFSIKSYRGLRLRQGLPVRGQRTHTNANTSKKRFL